jgi:carotenoid cleavage dioxygenase-like enzyme
MGILPSPMCMANTALLWLNETLYALFERDAPVKMDLDFTNKTLKTIGRSKIDGITHFSAHSIYNKTAKTIETIDYDVYTNRVKYAVLDEELNIIDEATIDTEYLPIVHDFASLPNTVLMTDSPFIAYPKNAFSKKMPVAFNPFLPTHIITMNKGDKTIRKYKIPESLYIFHYADVKETEYYITIYAAVYRELKLSTLDLRGSYSRIVIDKRTGQVKVDTTALLKYANLDFPKKWGEYIILRNVGCHGATSFIVCRELTVVSIIDFKDKHICGEPALVYIDDRTYLICFLYDSGFNGYMTIIDLLNYGKRFEIPLNAKVGIGFHSIFVSKNEQRY